MVLRTRAPAKVNLTLHVLRRRPDGYHELESLVAFAGVADILSLDPGRPLDLAVSGPTADAAGAPGDNLVLRGARALAERVPGLETGAFALTKRLPVGAGIGGGSSDAAAALRLLAELNGLSPLDERLHEAARASGADVPVCLDPRARVMRGIGDRLGARVGLGRLYAVLVNPGVHLDTRSVFARLGLAPGEEHGTEMVGEDLPPVDAPWPVIIGGRNDMEAAARDLAPVIPRVIAELAALAGCRLARMSGSGSTCFGLFTDRAAGRRAATIMRAAHPGWWVRATVLR